MLHALAALAELRARCDGTGPVIRNLQGEPLAGPRHWFEPAVRRANIRGFSWHCLRHTFATYINHLMKAGRATDLEVLDWLLRGVGSESREVLEKFRENHAFNPEKILATELHIALDEDFLPIEHLGDSTQIADCERMLVELYETEF